jgi:hypothetical protein
VRTIPWRGGEKPLEAVWFVRRAIWSAWEEARAARACLRRIRETEATVFYGLPSGLNPVDAIATDPETFLADEGLTFDDPDSVTVLGYRRFLTDQGFRYARMLGIKPVLGESEEQFVQRVYAAARGDAGNVKEEDVRAFIRYLALWWHRHTGRRPEAQQAVRSERADKKPKDPAKKRTTFLQFADVAAGDAGLEKGGVASISRMVRTEIDEMNRKNPPPPWIG